MAGRQGNKVAVMVVMYLLLIGTIATLIAACASTRWLATSGSFYGITFEIERGLWKRCSQGVCREELVNAFSEKGEFRAARAFMILAVLLSIVWAIVIVIGEILQGRKDIGKATVTLGCITAALAIATASLYLGYGEPFRKRGGGLFGDLVSPKYSAGFVLVWVSVPLAVGAAVASYFHFKYKFEQFQASGNQWDGRRTTTVSVVSVGQPVGQSHGQPQVAQPAYPSQQQQPQQPMETKLIVAQPYPPQAYPQASQAPPTAPMAQPAVAQDPPPYDNVSDGAQLIP